MSGQFVATRAALDKFGPIIIAAAHIMLHKEVRTKGGMDYLQVFEIYGDRLWFIDDVTMLRLYAGRLLISKEPKGDCMENDGKKCQNSLCTNPGVIEIPVSIARYADNKRIVCAPCQEAYNWGIQHGKTLIRQIPLWIVVVADSGIIAHVTAHSDQECAVKDLDNYLKENHGYQGMPDPTHLSVAPPQRRDAQRRGHLPGGYRSFLKRTTENT